MYILKSLFHVINMEAIILYLTRNRHTPIGSGVQRMAHHKQHIAAALHLVALNMNA